MSKVILSARGVTAYVGTLVAGGVIHELLRELLGKPVVDIALVFEMLIFLFLSIAVAANMGLLNRFDELDKRIGLKVFYIDHKRGRARLFRELRRHIERAQESISIVNTADGEVSSPELDPKVLIERRRYYQAILKRVSGHDLYYERIIQAKNDDNLQAMLRSEEYASHFHGMLDLAEKPDPRVGLIKVPATRPMTFTIIDQRWLLLQIDQRATDGGAHMHSIMIFDDPQQLVLRHFIYFYRAIRMKPIGEVKRSDLPPRTA